MIDVMLALELLGYVYRGCEYPNEGVCVHYASDQHSEDTCLLVGARTGDILDRIDELPIRNPDPFVVRLIERQRAKRR